MPDASGSKGCTLCAGAMPEGEWCRNCGNGLPAPPVAPMTGLRLAVRVAKGGPLTNDSEADVRAYLAGLRTDEGREMVARVLADQAIERGAS